MHNSLESRSPFLDQKIVNFAQSIPEKYKLSKHSNKIILRSIQKNLIPKELCTYKKIGFGIPMNLWLKNELREWVEDIIYSQTIENYKILNKKVILGRWSEFLNGNDHWGLSIWYICILQSWLNEFFSNRYN